MAAAGVRTNNVSWNVDQLNYYQHFDSFTRAVKAINKDLKSRTAILSPADLTAIGTIFSEKTIEGFKSKSIKSPNPELRTEYCAFRVLVGDKSEDAKKAQDAIGHFITKFFVEDETPVPIPVSVPKAASFSPSAEAPPSFVQKLEKVNNINFFTNFIKNFLKANQTTLFSKKELGELTQVFIDKKTEFDDSEVYFESSDIEIFRNLQAAIGKGSPAAIKAFDMVGEFVAKFSRPANVWPQPIEAQGSEVPEGSEDGEEPGSPIRRDVGKGSDVGEAEGSGEDEASDEEGSGVNEPNKAPAPVAVEGETSSEENSNVDEPKVAGSSNRKGLPHSFRNRGFSIGARLLALGALIVGVVFLVRWFRRSK